MLTPAIVVIILAAILAAPLGCLLGVLVGACCVYRIGRGKAPIDLAAAVDVLRGRGVKKEEPARLVAKAPARQET